MPMNEEKLKDMTDKELEDEGRRLADQMRDHDVRSQEGMRLRNQVEAIDMEKRTRMQAKRAGAQGQKPQQGAPKKFNAPRLKVDDDMPQKGAKQSPKSPSSSDLSSPATSRASSQVPSPNRPSPAGSPASSSSSRASTPSAAGGRVPQSPTSSSSASTPRTPAGSPPGSPRTPGSSASSSMSPSPREDNPAAGKKGPKKFSFDVKKGAQGAAAAGGKPRKELESGFGSRGQKPEERGVKQKQGAAMPGKGQAKQGIAQQMAKAQQMKVFGGGKQKGADKGGDKPKGGRKKI